MSLLLAVMFIQGCGKEDMSTTPTAAEFGGPCSATLVIYGSSSSGTKATVDTTNLVSSIRIYAFKHDETDETTNNELVGYGYYDGLSGGGPYYCTLGLTASGNIDFYVLCNDEYASITSINGVEGESLDEESTRAEIESVRFNGLITSDTAAIPMSNVQDGDTVDANNFTYNVTESTSYIRVYVTRAMARLSLYFAKYNADNDVIKITSARLDGVQFSVLLFPPGDSQVFDDNVIYEDSFSGETEIITTITDPTSIAAADYQLLDTETYMLPNPYGSSTPLVYTREDSASADSTLDDATAEKRSNVLTLGYSWDGVNKTATIYLPYSDPNDHIKVKGVFTGGETTNLNMTVTIAAWTTYTMNVEFE